MKYTKEINWKSSKTSKSSRPQRIGRSRNAEKLGGILISYYRRPKRFGSLKA